MNTTARPNASSASNGTSICISTGEHFPDGSVIEMISGPPGSEKPHLLLWDGSAATVGPRVEHGGRGYEAPALDPSLQRAMRLPGGCSTYRSARELFTQIRDLFPHYLGLPESDSGLVACFVISTWLADRLSRTPALTISGPHDQVGIELLRLLGCLCRRPLLLAELTPGTFRSLPMYLSPTLLLAQPELRPSMQRLLDASSYHGLHLVGNGGRIIDLCCAKAILCGDDAALDDLSSQVIRIALSPTRLQPSALDEQAQNEIANDFQPRLLLYRLNNLRKASASEVDVSKFSFEMRPLALALAQCFSEDSELAREVVQLLQTQDAEVREQRSRDPNCAILELLLAMIHEGKQGAVRVNVLTMDVNVILRSRGEILEFSPEEIGGRLRKMKIPRHENSSGREVVFNRDNSQRVHRLAQTYALLGGCVQRGCPDCNQAQVAVSE